MELKINSNNENKLLGRREITFSVEQDSSTPSKKDIVKEVCKKLNLSPESTIIVKIDQGFGTKQSSGLAHSYESKAAMEKSEPKHLLTRLGKSAAAEPAAQEAAKSE